VNRTEELLGRALGGLRVVKAAEGLRSELAALGGRDPAGLVLADLMVRHAEEAERAAMALRLRLRRTYDEAEADWGEP
jgi:hypothetical protein